MIADTKSSADLIAFIRGWFETLSANDYVAAAEAIDSPAWTSERLRAVIEQGLASSAVVTDPATAVGPDRASVIPLNEHRGYSIWHAVPLDGAWSDLTALFTFERRGSQLHVTLDDIHTL